MAPAMCVPVSVLKQPCRLLGGTSDRACRPQEWGDTDAEGKPVRWSKYHRKPDHHDTTLLTGAYLVRWLHPIPPILLSRCSLCVAPRTGSPNTIHHGPLQHLLAAIGHNVGSSNLSAAWLCIGGGVAGIDDADFVYPAGQRDTAQGRDARDADGAGPDGCGQVRILPLRPRIVRPRRPHLT